MHPQIVRQDPGSCPICGMALEPMLPAEGEAANPELRDMTRRFWVGVALSLPLIVLAMAANFVGLAPRTAVWLELILATPAVLWCGWPFFERGWRSILSRRLNMFTLIALGTGVAYTYSLVAALAPGIFPPSLTTAAFRSGSTSAMISSRPNLRPTASAVVRLSPVSITVRIPSS